MEQELETGMRRLHANQLWVLRIRAAMTAAIMLLSLAAGDFFFLRQTIVPAGFATGIGALLLLAWLVLVPGRRYRSWAYGVDADELHIQHGLWTRMRTIVPFGRVQHIDVAQGPLERALGIGTLILHTAGTRSSAVVLPGLGHADAERMRDLIRSKIRQELL